MVLRVELGSADASPYATSPDADGRVFLADVGFGAQSLIEPIPLVHGATAAQCGFSYTLRQDAGLWVLAMRDATQAMDLYEFSEHPQTIGDVVVANHFTSTHPESIFRKTLTIQRVCGNDRLILRSDTLTRWTNGRMTEEPIARARLAATARELFGVELPAGPLIFEQPGSSQSPS